MSRNPFGWSLPPGCTQRHIDEAAGVDVPCDVCGKPVDNCICSECPVCSDYGNPSCYVEHGLVRSAEQIASRAIRDAQEKAEAEWWDAYAKEMKSDDDDIIF